MTPATPAEEPKHHSGGAEDAEERRSVGADTRNYREGALLLPCGDGEGSSREKHDLEDREAGQYRAPREQVLQRRLWNFFRVSARRRRCERHSSRKRDDPVLVELLDLPPVERRLRQEVLG